MTMVEILLAVGFLALEIAILYAMVVLGLRVAGLTIILGRILFDLIAEKFNHNITRYKVGKEIRAEVRRQYAVR